MKLRTRFALSHGGAVVVTLLTSFFLIYEGSRFLYQRQARLNQQQEISAFAIAAREALTQREDIAIVKFMKSVVKDPLVAYAAYFNPASNLYIVFPQSLEKEFREGKQKTIQPDSSAGDSNHPFLYQMANGMKVVEWRSFLKVNENKAGAVWLGYSQDALDRDLSVQTRRWLPLEAAAGVMTLLLGWLLSFWLGGYMAAPLKAISEGTHLVRSGKLDSLVEVRRKDEIGDLARDFNAMVVQLKELDEMKRDFVAGVTHDLGTPLHAIRSAINFLQAGDAGPLTEKQTEYLLLVSNSSTNLTSFINNLLTTAKIEAAKVEPYPEPIDVFTHVKELVDLYQPQARERGTKLILTKKAQYISLVADVTMFRQIVLNLLSNALKFTDKGEVEVALSEDNGNFLLEVRDTGIGIDPQYQQLIFEKFYRVRQPGSSPARQGSGLGLAIVKGLVEAQGGKVTVESVPGKGSIFRVLLPKQPRRF